MTNRRDESSEECCNCTLFLKKLLCLNVVRLIQEDISSILMDERLDYWSAKITTKYIVDNRAKICTSGTCEEY